MSMEYSRYGIPGTSRRGVFKRRRKEFFSKNMYHPPQIGGGLIQDGPPSPGVGFGAPARNIYLGHL